MAHGPWRSDPGCFNQKKLTGKTKHYNNNVTPLNLAEGLGEPQNETQLIILCKKIQRTYPKRIKKKISGPYVPPNHNPNKCEACI